MGKGQSRAIVPGFYLRKCSLSGAEGRIFDIIFITFDSSAPLREQISNNHEL